MVASGDVKIWSYKFIFGWYPSGETRCIWFYRWYYHYFEVNGKQYRNPVYEYLYYHKSLEPDLWLI